ncbi:MAG: hypothetical protein K0U68_09205 [Gammaproteobacteria bacterium]|nr:hypothetical protein [Gammaproteobacteria bacterium]
MTATHHLLIGLAVSLLSLTSLVSADRLVVDQQPVCQEIAAVNWQNDRLAVNCRDDRSANPPVNQPPVSAPDVPASDLPDRPPLVTPPGAQSPLSPLPVDCPPPGPNVRIERFTGAGIDQEFTLDRGSVLVVPFHSGPTGTVKKIALGEPGRGQHFQKTVIISQCPGVYNPGAYDFKSSVDVCVVTGLELSFSVIAGNSRSDYPLSSYRCVVLPNTTYHLTLFQHHAGNRPPYTANTDTTCTSQDCGVRVSIR